jgi:hypothetical protein
MLIFGLCSHGFGFGPGFGSGFGTGFGSGFGTGIASIHVWRFIVKLIMYKIKLFITMK